MWDGAGFRSIPRVSYTQRRTKGGGLYRTKAAAPTAARAARAFTPYVAAPLEPESDEPWLWVTDAAGEVEVEVTLAEPAGAPLVAEDAAVLDGAGVAVRVTPWGLRTRVSFSVRRETKGGAKTHDCEAELLGGGLCVLEVAALAGALDAGGDGGDEGLAVAKAGVVKGVAGAEVGVGEAGVGAG